MEKFIVAIKPAACVTSYRSRMAPLRAIAGCCLFPDIDKERDRRLYLERSALTVNPDVSHNLLATTVSPLNMNII